MNLFAIAGLVLGLTSLLLAIFVFSLRKTKLHNIWALFNLAVSIWGFGCLIVGTASTELIALFGWKFAHVGGLFISIFFFHMVCEFCSLKRKKSIIASYLMGITFLYINIMTQHLINKTQIIFDIYYNDATWVYFLAVGLWLILVIWSFIELLKYNFQIKGIKQTQTVYIIVGFLIGFVGGITNFVPMFGIYVYPFGNFTIPVYCLIVTYAILRYRLMDIRLIFKRTMAYSLSAGLLMGIFVVIVLVITKVFSLYTQEDSFKISIIAALVIALLFNPLRSRIQSLVDKVFYKKSFDYYETIRKISHDLASILDLKNIYNFVGDIVFSTLGLKNIYLLSAVTGRSYEVVYSKSFGEDRTEQEKEEELTLKIEKNSNLIKLMKTSDDIVIKDELPGIVEILGQETISNIEHSLKPFNGEAVLPVFVDDKLALLLIIGEKLSGDIFTDEDVKLLDTIAHQTSISIKNAKLYREKLSSEKLASMGMISGTFAHEIRNPLTAIKTFAQLMPDKYADAEFREGFSKIVVNEIERIDGLIKDLMDFSTNKAIPHSDNINMTLLFDEMIEYTKNRLKMEKNEISVEKVYKNVKIDVLGDSKKLKQAFMNLINNSCQAMNERGVLRVDLNLNRQNVNVKIIDTGKGITRDEIDMIFDPFYTTRPMGVGLGLAISKKIIEDHGGSITVESDLSKGTTFTVSLPVQNTDEA